MGGLIHSGCFSTAVSQIVPLHGVRQLVKINKFKEEHMAIEYRVIPRKILAGEDKGKVKYYATASNTGRTDLDDLTRDIER